METLQQKIDRLTTLVPVGTDIQGLLMDCLRARELLPDWYSIEHLSEEQMGQALDILLAEYATS